MTAPLLELAAIALVFGAFALAQSVARAQPLAGLGQTRTAARIFALTALGVATRTASVALGLGEAVLLVLAALAAAASIFVPLAAVRPSWAWRAAMAAPVTWLLLVLVSRRVGP